MFIRFTAISSAMAFALAVSTPARGDEPADFERDVAPFFGRYCIDCHTGESPEGNFSVQPDQLSVDFHDPATRSEWREIVNVLNSHEMPPEDHTQPQPDEVAKVVDWITGRAVDAELQLREQTVVMRRLNREEYRNTIRDLVGVDFDVSSFPEDPSAGGFDNNGRALSTSPLQVEMYLAAGRQILDRAMPNGDPPPVIRWRFDPQVGPADRVRQRIDERNNPLVNGGNNSADGDWVVVRNASWDKGVGARDFRMAHPGLYKIRLRAAGRVPSREEVLRSAEENLRQRRDEQDAKDPDRKASHQEAYERDLEHFRTDPMYDYGPPRAKLIVKLGSQPYTLAEFDVGGSPDDPKTYEFDFRFTEESAGVSFEYAYSIPRVLENFWMQGLDSYARPELMIDWFEVEGPIYDAWPPSSYTKLLFDSPLSRSDETAYAREVLARFMRRAYRRPVDAAEIDEKLAMYLAARKGNDFVDAIKLPLNAVLASPHFLYLVEPGRAAAPLDDHQLAARMSYFLWSSMPDEELSQLADARKLQDPSVRKSQIDRMLDDPKSEALVANFCGQWLGLRAIGLNPPAEDLFPHYDRHLETSIVAESLAYFSEFLHNDLDVRQMIRSDFVTINERLARFYGIPGVRGDQFRRVSVPADVPRGGIVTQASVLTLTSNGTRTSPVKRGTWILKTLLGTDPGLPVANAGEIAPKVPGIDKATVRQRLEAHRELPQCARCHSKIDPLGFALENYNAAGQWREQEGFGYKGRINRDDPAIDAASRMPDGTQIDGVEELQHAMLAKDELFLRTLSGKLLTFALGRELGLADEPSVKAAVADVKSGGHTLRSLLRHIVASDAFATK